MAAILCVDDDDAIRFLLQRILSTAGYDATACDNGAAALELVAQNAPDLLVLDLEMPGLSGFEVCRRVKANPFTARIPVLMVTAQSDIESKIAGFEAGADDYLGKPFLPQELTVRVASLLRLVQRESDRNPSSGLPGGQAIAQAIEARRGQDFAILYIDLDHFKPFADHFGFSHADCVIQDTGKLVANSVALHDKTAPGQLPDLAGHIGGDDFLVVTTSERAKRIASTCSAGFRQVVADCIGEAAMARGTFEGVARDGRWREFPLAQITTTIIEVGEDDDFSVHHLGVFAANAKREARQRQIALEAPPSVPRMEQTEIETDNMAAALAIASSAP